MLKRLIIGSANTHTENAKAIDITKDRLNAFFAKDLAFSIFLLPMDWDIPTSAQILVINIKDAPNQTRYKAIPTALTV